MSRLARKPHMNPLQYHQYRNEEKKSNNAGKLVIVAMALILIGLISTDTVSIGKNFMVFLTIGVCVYFLSVINILYGLAITVIAFCLSPDIIVGGFPLRLEDFLIPALAINWFIKNLGSRNKVEPTPLKSSFISIIFLGLISTMIALTAYNLNFNSAAQYYLKNLEYFVLFFLALNILKNRQDVHFILTVLLISSAFVGVYGSYQVLTKGESFGFRVSGPNGETSNILGGFYAFCMAVASGVFLCTNKGRLKMMIVIYLGVFMLWPLLQTLSRASFVSMLFALLFIGVVAKRQVLLWVGSFMIILPLAFPTFIYDRMKTVLGVVGIGEMPTSWQDKMLGWEILWHTRVTHNPLTVFIGNGVGSINLQIDNEYMKILGETGFIGLIIFIIMIVAVSKLTWKVYKESKDPIDQGLALGFVGGIVALLIQGFSGTVFTTMRTMQPFILLCALISILNNINKTEKGRRHSGKRRPDNDPFLARNSYNVVEVFKQRYRTPQAAHNAPPSDQDDEPTR